MSSLRAPRSYGSGVPGSSSEVPELGSQVIYVNSKTRNQKPFFVETRNYFTQGLMHLDPKPGAFELMSAEEWTELLNQNVFYFENLLQNGQRLNFCQGPLSKSKIKIL